MILQDDNVSDEIKGIIKASTDEVAPSEELKTVFIGCQVAKTIDASVHITNVSNLYKIKMLINNH